jgi:hypothetical protein
MTSTQRLMAGWMNRTREWNGRLPYSSRKIAPMVEACESRQLLCTTPLTQAIGGFCGPVSPVPVACSPILPITCAPPSGSCGGSGSGSQAGGIGVIAGTAFVDLNHDGKLGTNDVYLPNATVQLFKPGQCSPISTTKTDSYGAYKFDGLAPGDYIVKEIPPCGYSSSGSQVDSQLNPGQSLSCQTMKVTVVNPNKVFVDYQSMAVDKWVQADVIVNGNSSRGNAIGPMTIALGSTPGGTDLNCGFSTLCVNDEQYLNFSGEQTFQVIPKAGIELTFNADSSGRIGYLFNHYGNSSLTNVTGPALQMAVWELLYDGNEQTPDFWAGKFQLNSDLQNPGAPDINAVLAQAKEFYNESAGKREAVGFLETKTYDAQGQQSVLAHNSFNFGNTPDCTSLSHQTGTVDYWTSCAGQRVIQGFNGGGCSTQLSNWLATTCPNLYGPGTGGCANPYDLSGKTNADVAALVQKLAGCGWWAVKPEGQILATALGEYASTLSLGGSSSCNSGFRVTAGGLGAVDVNVACSGTAFGVANCSTQNVSTLLKAVDAQAKNGRLFDGNTCLGQKASSLFCWVNERGSVGSCW